MLRHLSLARTHHIQCRSFFKARQAYSVIYARFPIFTSQRDLAVHTTGIQT